MKRKEFLNKKFYLYGSLIFLLLLTIGVTFATFSDTADFSSSTFSVASSDIKLLNVIGGGTDSTNLVDEKAGPQFEDIIPYWSKDYLVQIYNNSNSDVALSSWADYENVATNDPAELRQYIFVEMYDWDDLDGNGDIQQEEIGASYGRKTILKWKTEGFDLGVIPSDQIRGIILRFSTDNLSDSKQGATLLYDFKFDALGL